MNQFDIKCENQGTGLILKIVWQGLPTRMYHMIRSIISTKRFKKTLVRGSAPAQKTTSKIIRVSCLGYGGSSST